MSEGLGVRGTMLDFNPLFQLHYKVGYVYHMKPTFYKSLYVREGIFPELRHGHKNTLELYSLKPHLVEKVW